MLQHARRRRGPRQPTDVNALLAEAVTLATHGGDSAPPGPRGRGHDRSGPRRGQRSTRRAGPQRVFLNLLLNAFYALADKRRQARRSVRAAAHRAHAQDASTTVEIRIRDNGPGIPAAVRDKLFSPSSPPSRRARAPASDCRSATTSSSSSTAGRSASRARKASTRSSSSSCRAADFTRRGEISLAVPAAPG